MANLRNVEFSPSIDINTARSGKFFITSANICFSSDLLPRFEKQPKNSRQLPKPTRNTREIANKLKQSLLEK